MRSTNLLTYLLNLGPKAVISRGEQNLYGWQRRTSYGAADKILRQLTAYEVYGGLRRRLGALKMNCLVGLREGGKTNCCTLALLPVA